MRIKKYPLQKSITTIVVFLALNGCASLTHFNKERSLEDNKAFFVDAKQRSIYKFKRWESYDKKKDGGHYWEGFCAEPAPSAISALATTLGIDLTVAGKGELGVSQALAEGVGSIGIRTAAIEALRDIMYRNCEAYAMGGMSPAGLETLQRRFQSTMVAILAIEQLTGAVRSPATIIVSETSSGSPEAVVDLTNKTEVARISLLDAKESEVKLKESLDKKTKLKVATEQKKKDEKSKIDELEAKSSRTAEEDKKLLEYKKVFETTSATLIQNETDEKASKTKFILAQQITKDRDQMFKALDASRVATLTGGGVASTTGKIETLQKGALSDIATEKVAEAVQGIVEKTLAMNYSDEVCTTIIGQNPDSPPQKGSPLWVCNALLISEKQLNPLQRKRLGIIDESPGIYPDTISLAVPKPYRFSIKIPGKDKIISVSFSKINPNPNPGLVTKLQKIPNNGLMLYTFEIVTNLSLGKYEVKVNTGINTPAYLYTFDVKS